jgi:hypothetical protein
MKSSNVQACLIALTCSSCVCSATGFGVPAAAGSGAAGGAASLVTGSAFGATAFTADLQGSDSFEPF